MFNVFSLPALTFAPTLLAITFATFENPSLICRPALDSASPVGLMIFSFVQFAAVFAPFTIALPIFDAVLAINAQWLVHHRQLHFQL